MLSLQVDLAKPTPRLPWNLFSSPPDPPLEVTSSCYSTKKSSCYSTKKSSCYSTKKCLHLPTADLVEMTRGSRAIEVLGSLSQLASSTRTLMPPSIWILKTMSSGCSNHREVVYPLCIHSAVRVTVEMTTYEQIFSGHMINFII